MMLYDIRLSIAHKYEHPAGLSRHVIRVLPKANVPSQRVNSHLVEVYPLPTERFDTFDFFGNSVTSVAHFAPHDEMDIRMACRVEVIDMPAFFDVSPGLGDLAREIERVVDLTPDSPMHFLGPSTMLRTSSDVKAFARSVVNPEASCAAQVLDFGRALHQAMTFDATATTVETDPIDAFHLRRGVCQDFTHIMILGLRSLGIPSGYVSGFLRTLPPPGGVRLEGADAMHAWVRAWCGGAQGWIEYDPTNDTLASTDHIVVGYGRDYADVSPVIGNLRSSGGQKNRQSVDVRPIDQGP